MANIVFDFQQAVFTLESMVAKEERRSAKSPILTTESFTVLPQCEGCGHSLEEVVPFRVDIRLSVRPPCRSNGSDLTRARNQALSGMPTCPVGGVLFLCHQSCTIWIGNHFAYFILEPCAVDSR